jgi:transcriptional regulator with XRE-family HTH domain
MENISRKLREIRQAKGYTLAHLAGLCGLTKGYLSKIEHGRKVPPVYTLLAIAQALETDIGDFLDKNAGKPPKNHDIDITRGNDRGNQQMASSAGYAFQALVESFKNKYISPFLMRIKKGTTDSLTHDSEEFFYVLRGEIQLGYNGKTFTLKEGDTAYFDSRKKHHFRNTRREDALLLSVNFNYRRF